MCHPLPCGANSLWQLHWLLWLVLALPLSTVLLVWSKRNLRV